MALPPLPGMPALALPGVLIQPLPDLQATLLTEDKPKPKRRMFKFLIILTLVGIGAFVYASQNGLLDQF